MEICTAHPLNSTKRMDADATPAEIWQWWLDQGHRYENQSTMHGSLYKQAKQKGRLSPKQMAYVSLWYRKEAFCVNYTADRTYGHEWVKNFTGTASDRICKYCNQPQQENK